MEFNKEELIKSPLNFTGGKFKLLPQILPLFPEKIDTFVDVFGGGLDVCINVQANKVIVNDIITPMIDLYNYWLETPIDETLDKIFETIDKFSLSKENLDGYINIRDEYNKFKSIELLFPIIAHCYNNQIRFNSKWEFNRHFGKNRSHFNDNMKNNLINTLNAIKLKHIKFINKDVFDLNFEKLNSNHFIYLDPPYLITYADYSIQASWNDEKEINLLKKLDKLNTQGIKFALSNVIEHNGKINNILKEWSKNYNINYLDYNYNNSNADKKIKKNGNSVEVLITNY